MSTSYVGFKGEKLLFSLTFYIYYSKIFRTFQIIFFRILRESGAALFIFFLTFYIYYKAILKLFQISICGNAATIEVAARWMRAENLTKNVKFLNKFKRKFDFKNQILIKIFAAPKKFDF